MVVYTYNLFKRYTFALIFILTRISYGALNILKGNIINPLSPFIKIYHALHCKDWELLFGDHAQPFDFFN